MKDLEKVRDLAKVKVKVRDLVRDLAKARAGEGLGDVEVEFPPTGVVVVEATAVPPDPVTTPAVAPPEDDGP